MTLVKHRCEDSPSLRLLLVRVFMIENSVAMQKHDAFLPAGDLAAAEVTRWDELTEYVTFHTKMASRCGISTKFQFLHKPNTKGRDAERRAAPREFSVGGSKGGPEDVETANAIMAKVTPSAPSAPLAECARSFAKKLQRDSEHVSYLKQRNKFITFSIATQGVPTAKEGQSEADAFRDLRRELVALKGMPVKLIVRLCTNDEDTFSVYNKFDSMLEYCDVLDDFKGESMEVYLHNPWLTYSLGLHRLREAGLAWKGLGELDERTFTLDEIHKLCTELFGMDRRDLPRPGDDWDGFVEALHRLNKRESPQYSAVKKRKTSWIDLRKLESRKKDNRSSRSRSSRKSSQTGELTLDDYVNNWAYDSSNGGSLRPLAVLLVTVEDTFPPYNKSVEPHDYFSGWRPLPEDVFEECGEELHYLLKRSLRKIRMFLQPDRVPADATERQDALFRKLRGVFSKKSEQMSL